MSVAEEIHAIGQFHDEMRQASSLFDSSDLKIVQEYLDSMHKNWEIEKCREILSKREQWMAERDDVLQRHPPLLNRLVNYHVSLADLIGGIPMLDDREDRDDGSTNPTHTTRQDSSSSSRRRRPKKSSVPAPRPRATGTPVVQPSVERQQRVVPPPAKSTRRSTSPIHAAEHWDAYRPAKFHKNAVQSRWSEETKRPTRAVTQRVAKPRHASTRPEDKHRIKPQPISFVPAVEFDDAEAEAEEEEQDEEEQEEEEDKENREDDKGSRNDIAYAEWPGQDEGDEADETDEVEEMDETAEKDGPPEIPSAVDDTPEALHSMDDQGMNSGSEEQNRVDDGDDTSATLP